MTVQMTCQMMELSRGAQWACSGRGFSLLAYATAVCPGRAINYYAPLLPFLSYDPLYTPTMYYFFLRHGVYSLAWS